MRNACIKSFNKFYSMDIKLKEKQKGRNQDINVKDMSNYTNMKKHLAEKEKKLDKANKQTDKLDNTTKDINQILDKLKPAKFSKNNMVISNEDIEKIKNFTKDVKDTTKIVRSVNDLNIAIRDFEHSAFEIEKENCSLKYQIELKDDEICNLKSELSTKDRIIDKLKEEKEGLKSQLQKFKGFWHSIMSHFHKKFHSFLASLKGTHRNEILELEAFSLYNISQGNIYYKARGGELQTSATLRLNQYKKQCKCSCFKHT